MSNIIFVPLTLITVFAFSVNAQAERLLGVYESKAVSISCPGLNSEGKAIDNMLMITNEIGNPYSATGVLQPQPETKFEKSIDWATFNFSEKMDPKTNKPTSPVYNRRFTVQVDRNGELIQLQLIGWDGKTIRSKDGLFLTRYFKSAAVWVTPERQKLWDLVRIPLSDCRMVLQLHPVTVNPLEKPKMHQEYWWRK